MSSSASLAATMALLCDRDAAAPTGGPLASGYRRAAESTSQRRVAATSGAAPASLAFAAASQIAGAAPSAVGGEPYTELQGPQAATTQPTLPCSRAAWPLSAGDPLALYPNGHCASKASAAAQPATAATAKRGRSPLLLWGVLVLAALVLLQLGALLTAPVVRSSWAAAQEQRQHAPADVAAASAARKLHPQTHAHVHAHAHDAHAHAHDAHRHGSKAKVVVVARSLQDEAAGVAAAAAVATGFGATAHAALSAPLQRLRLLLPSASVAAASVASATTSASRPWAAVGATKPTAAVRLQPVRVLVERHGAAAGRAAVVQARGRASAAFAQPVVPYAGRLPGRFNIVGVVFYGRRVEHHGHDP